MNRFQFSHTSRVVTGGLRTGSAQMLIAEAIRKLED